MKNDPEFLQFKKFKEIYKNITEPSRLEQAQNLLLRKPHWIYKFTQHNSATQHSPLKKKASQKEHTFFYHLLKIDLNHFQANLRFKQRRLKGHPYLDLSLYRDDLMSPSISQQNQYRKQYPPFYQCPKYSFPYNQRASQINPSRKGSNNNW